MDNKHLTLGSLFDGSGGFPLGGILAGIEPKWASEIEPFPIRVTSKRLPSMKHLGDISLIEGAEITPVDIITFGSPCFPAGTLVLTDNGYVPIEELRIGDMVLTHKGRYKRITAIGSHIDETIVLKGNHYGLECTPNHPIYSATKRTEYPRKPDGKRSVTRILEQKREWIEAKEMLNKLWATPISFAFRPIPINTSTNKRYKPMPDITNELMYFVGRWLGDGWVRDVQRFHRPIGSRFSTIYVCDSLDKENELHHMFSALFEHFSVEYGATCVKFKTNGRLFCDWLVENFGKGAENKKMPSWVYSMDVEKRKCLLQGILDSDGYCKNVREYKVTSISKKLVNGIRLLAETLGYSTTIHKNIPYATKKLCGRLVHQKTQYQVVLIKSEKRAKLFDDLHAWYQVRSVTSTGERKEVFNISVEDDESYVAEGIVVHNCQDMSIAGKRDGLAGARSGLFYEALRIVKEMRDATDGKYPRFIVWENVLGAFSSNKGEDFHAVLEEIAGVKESVHVPKSDKWTQAGEIVGDGYSIAWRVLDAQFWGVPQRRQRIFLVADFDGQSAGKILFDSEGVSGYSAESFSAWQRAASAVEGCIGKASSLCLNDQGGNRMDVTEGITATLRATANHPPVVFENHSQDTRYRETGETAPSVLATYGTGGNNQPFVVEEPKCFDVRFTSEGTKNARQNVYATETSRTIDTGGNSPDSNQGGVAVVAYGIDRAAFNQGKNAKFGFAIEEELEPTMVAKGAGAVAHRIYSSSKASYFTAAVKDKANTLVATDYKDPPLVGGENNYIVRRLMPTECARLQGFPDWWCADLGVENPTDEDIALWKETFLTYAKVMGKSQKPKSDEQIRKWLQNPHSDSAEYKLWGNGVALPCVYFVLAGIAYYAK